MYTYELDSSGLFCIYYLTLKLIFAQFGQHLANWHRDSDRIHNRFVVCVCVCVCVLINIFAPVAIHKHPVIIHDLLITV